MTFVVEKVRLDDLAEVLAELEIAGFELLQCLPLVANMGELKESARLLCIWGPKPTPSNGNGNGNGGEDDMSITLVEFMASGDAVFINPAEVTVVEEKDTNKTTIYMLDGNKFEVDETASDVATALTA